MTMSLQDCSSLTQDVMRASFYQECCAVEDIGSIWEVIEWFDSFVVCLQPFVIRWTNILASTTIVLVRRIMQEVYQHDSELQTLRYWQSVIMTRKNDSISPLLEESSFLDCCFYPRKKLNRPAK